MATSPLAPIIANTLRQSCTVYKYIGTLATGQPEYGEGTVTPCRIAIREARAVQDIGDEVSNSGIVILLPADADIDAYDRIDLPDGYDQGAVVREVRIMTDSWGDITHKGVSIQ